MVSSSRSLWYVEESNTAQEITDQRSLSTVLEGHIGGSSQQPVVSSSIEDSDHSDSSSSRPRRERKMPERYGKYVVHVVEGHSLEVGKADLEKSYAQAANEIPQGHSKKKIKQH